MAEIERFEAIPNYAGGYTLHRNPSGEWVKFSDHQAALQCERERWEAEAGGGEIFVGLTRSQAQRLFDGESLGEHAEFYMPNSAPGVPDPNACEMCEAKDRLRRALAERKDCKERNGG